jgi:hypothetical protein
MDAKTGLRNAGIPKPRRLFMLLVVLAASAMLAGLSFLAGLTSAGHQANADAPSTDADKAAIGQIYELQAAFHRAKTNQDIDLMMSLWAPDGILHVQGDPQSPYVGTTALRTFWLNSGSFKNHRFSLVPSFKTTIDVHGAEAQLYFECHDVGNSDQPSRSIVADTFLAGTVRLEAGRWVFADMTAGKSSPLSPDHYYFP